MYSASLECSRGVWLLCLGIWFRGDSGSDGLMVGPDDLKGILQP